MHRRDFLQTTTGLAAASALANSPHLVRAAGEKPQSPVEPRLAPRFGDARDWWFERRFGLFIHWGLYSIDGWHEQDQWRRRIPRSEYVQLAQRWNPIRFDPDQWLDLAERVGMKYICVTTKHHDGFCLFASRACRSASVRTRNGIESWTAAWHRP